MIIEAVDDRQDLYQVRNIIPKNLMDELDNQVLEALPYTKQPWQETFERRSLSIMPGSVFERINSFLYDQKQHIGDCINKKIQKLKKIKDNPDYDINVDEDDLDEISEQFKYLKWRNKKQKYKK